MVHPTTLNILQLGETGVGKSAFINAIYNYLVFYSFDDACAGDLQTLIYSEFNFKGQKITCGVPDVAEGAGNSKPGSSCTQRCEAYTFTVAGGKTKIRLIDTPGIADTTGFIRDEQNMKDIVSYISQYEVLHAICILLKPNEVRLTLVLRYCIVELLAHLHKDASSNILFCFTNSRNTFFEAGETFHLLQHVLSETPQTKAIKLLPRETVYYFDSEAFRYLACLKSDLQFKESEKRAYESSWDQSTEEAKMLIQRIAGLDPHDIKSTLSLNLVRAMLVGIEDPLAKLTEAIHHNLEQTKKHTMDIVSLVEAEIRQALIIKEEVLETVPLGHSRTICNSQDKCRGGICHEPCCPTETFLGRGQCLISEEDGYQLFCNKFSLMSSACTVCQCSRSSHIRVSTETRTVVREREDENIRKAIDEADDCIERESRLLKILKERENSYNGEMEVVVNAAALFVGFLEQNAFIVYHCATREYLEAQMEMMKKSGANVEKQRIAEFEDHLKRYDQELRNFKARCGPGSSEKITVEHVEAELQKLYALTESGAAIQEVMRDIKKGYYSRFPGSPTEVIVSTPGLRRGGLRGFFGRSN